MNKIPAHTKSITSLRISFLNDFENPFILASLYRQSSLNPLPLPQGELEGRGRWWEEGRSPSRPMGRVVVVVTVFRANKVCPWVPCHVPIGTLLVE